MAQILTNAEKFHSANGLVCLVQALSDHYTVIDLRNESYVSGKIEEVDGFMNITMSDVIFTDAKNKNYAFDQFFIPMRMIRYVHIPERFKILPTIENQLKSGRSRRKVNTEKSFKVRRAEMRQKETLDMIAKLKMERLQKVKENEEK